MSDVAIWFNGWTPIIRILVVGTLAYLALVILLRSANKRTLARLNAFDFVLTVAIGASFGRILTARQVPLAEAATAFALLVLLHYGVSWARMRLGPVAKLLNSPPSLLFYRGEFLHKPMKVEHVTEDDLESVVRQHGVDSFGSVEAIVLESSGKFSVIKKRNAGADSLTEPLKEE